MREDQTSKMNVQFCFRITCSESCSLHTIHVRTAFEARRDLAKVLEEIGKL
jgi:hypothetical protein